MIKERKVRMRRNFVGVGIGVFVTVAALTGCVTGNGSNTNVANNKEVSKVEVTQEPSATPKVTPEPTEAPEEKEARETREFLESLPVGRRAAVESAVNYMTWCNLSPSGLYNQLLYEGFSEQDSKFAVDHMNVDWNVMCYNKAMEYITNIGGFSEEGLINQLMYDGFEEKQAKKAVKNLGY